ncbi:putative autotransporter adhesin-like protein [Tenacibaculum lutimaris]|uniref:Putative autotransporter adhesin-like protein n=1 Tax=Tenacibaculum lutimaris TaxID=285258 RepID=A0A420E4M6_9FLAO|nr:head GIN domain-containing protein [Tenacibaculum lutimaris]RKF05131.1 putative autotransporter adhesin-like protein [Tenacibaculum lutimaris]
MKNLVFISLFLITVIASAQTTMTKELGSFYQVKVYNGIDLELVKSNESKIVVTGEKTDKVKIKVEGYTLKVLLKFPETTADGKVKATLYYKEDIDVIDANEGATITGKDINQQKVEIKAQEGAFINLVVKVKHLKVKSSSGAVIRLSGSTKNQNVDADLGGMYHGYKVAVEEMTIVKAGSGSKVEVQAGETLDAKVSFGGSIFYKGKPEVFRDKKVIGGVIEHRG